MRDIRSLRWRGVKVSIGVFETGRRRIGAGKIVALGSLDAEAKTPRLKDALDVRHMTNGAFCGSPTPIQVSFNHI
jgi:hypothetical protein